MTVKANRGSRLLFETVTTMLPLHKMRKRPRASLSFVKPRSPIRIVTPLLITFALGCLILFWTKLQQLELPNMNTRTNYILAHAPRWLGRHPEWIWKNHPHFGDAEDIEILRHAPWPGIYETPRLGHVVDGKGDGALLMLHIFSMPNKHSRERRALLRKYHPLQTIPEEYRHLVEIKFVLGRYRISPEPEMGLEERKKIEMEEEEMEAEQDLYGDLIRLEGLYGGENMNQGKTIEWMKWVGREGGREAQWVIKCDDDTLPILPNLLPFLTSLDPSKPAYLGTALGHWNGYVYYFEGMMYGFNWGVIKTMANANLGDDIIHRNFDEDAYMGLLMYNLPSKPTHPLALSPSTNPHPQDPSSGLPIIPHSPDPRTGLMRIDLGNRLGGFEAWWIAGPRRAIAWHGLKDDRTYVRAHDYAVRGFQRMGKKFMWTPPRSFRRLAIKPKPKGGDRGFAK